MNTSTHSLPIKALTRYLEHHVAEIRGPLNVTKFKGGQSNPTFLLESPSGRWVLRRKPPGILLISAHAVDREFEVISALYGSKIPVAHPLHLCRDDSVIGSMFYVMEFLDGQVFWNPALPEIEPSSRQSFYHAAVAILAAIHQVDVDAIGLSRFGKPGNYFARQIQRWSDQYRAAETEQVLAMEHLLAWLPSHCPIEDGRVSLVHGDFRFDNLMFNHHSPTLLAVMDWELSTLGHPLADLGYFCMALRLPQNRVLSGLRGMDRSALGIPDEAQLIQRYFGQTGPILGTDWEFYLAFNFFRLAAIAQGVYKRALVGNASSEHALMAGTMMQQVAQLGADLCS